MPEVNLKRGAGLSGSAEARIRRRRIIDLIFLLPLFVLYQLLILILIFVAVPAFLLRSRGRAHLGERLGVPSRTNLPVIVVHGASLGEVSGLEPLIAKMKPNIESQGKALLITATSDTGRQKGVQICGWARLLPFDSLLLHRLAFGGLKIEMVFISEKDLWPGFLVYLQLRKVPCFLVNARKPRRRARCWTSLQRRLNAYSLGSFERIFTATEDDSQYFSELGIEKDRLTVAGNTKYDRGVLGSAEQERLARGERANCQPLGRVTEEPVLVLGSLRPGEEEIWFGELASACSKWSIKLRTIVAPRYLDRVEYFLNQLEVANLSAITLSELVAEQPAATLEGLLTSWVHRSDDRILVIDRLGLLERLYSVATLAFIGGSLVDAGGHNPLEAAQWGVPVAMGPYVENVTEVCGELMAAGALFRINDRGDICRLLSLLACDTGENRQLLRESGAAARRVAASFTGAVNKIISALEDDAAFST